MPATKQPPPEPSRTEPNSRSSDRSEPTLGRRPSRKESQKSQKRPRSSSRKLSKSNAPSIRNAEKNEDIPPMPALPEQRRNELNELAGLNRMNIQATQPPTNRDDIPSYYFQNPMSQSSLQPEKFSVIREPPTLQAKRSAHDQGILRRKSSKKKRDDHAREQEIKAMSAPIPIPKRPKSYQTDMLARDSKRIPGDLNRSLDRPLSNVSLPLAESLHSQMSTSFDAHAFQVGSLGALVPRPTIRYSGTQASPSGSLRPSRTSTRKDKQPMIFEADEPLENPRRRIDDLADDMDAGSLRELMDRDRRRLEKRRKSENERLQRRLQKKSEHQRQQEEAVKWVASQEGEQQPHAGLGTKEPPTDPDTDAVATPKKGDGTRTPESWLKDPSRERLVPEDPFHDPFVGASTSHLEEATPIEEREEPVLATAKAIRLSSASMTPPTSPSRQIHDPRHLKEPSSLSQFSELAPSSTPDIPEKPEPEQKTDSDTGGKLSSSWKSIFRRSDTRVKRGSADRGRADRAATGRGTPSEFSNTSRESFSRQMQSSSFPRVPRVRSGTPIRTQSIFKEDLPELPISPPDSRMQSPETAGQAPLPGIPGSRGNDAAGAGEEPPLSDIHPAYRAEVALSRNASLRAKSPEEPQSATISESLASVDAEGSWLTGKPVKRTSTPQPLRESFRLEHPEDSDEDSSPGTPPAEKYMGSLTPVRSKSKRSVDEALVVPQRIRPRIDPGSSTGDDHTNDNSALHSAPYPGVQEEGTTWHSAVGKHPTIVRPGVGNRARSREGLLNDFQGAESGNIEESRDSSQSPSEHSPSSPEGPPPIQRAVSVDLGKGHARHISAGSAKLLNLPPRSSMEIKRLSSGSAHSGGEKSPLSQSPRVPEETKADDVD
ncbi:uncharacterized protein KY384_007781 [Bacidia gigantensis]|uniref:uncharacterized protein n=1 Tax=Bacidia gigantensis TaxID=2732470 RepID=UPI001D04794E|nr:uncharacterized protein KY384_007781 [Bacidia gigantensis]KAG8527628.1 hypothetical protein KY384_007781 [Bacidia gigantensis]